MAHLIFNMGSLYWLDNIFILRRPILSSSWGPYTGKTASLYWDDPLLFAHNDPYTTFPVAGNPSDTLIWYLYSYYGLIAGCRRLNTLQWHHHILNHWWLNYMFNSLLRLMTQKTSKLCWLLTDSPHKGPVMRNAFSWNDVIIGIPPAGLLQNCVGSWWLCRTLGDINWHQPCGCLISVPFI